MFSNWNSMVFGDLSAGALRANWHWVILVLQWWTRTNYALGTSQGECLLTQFTKEVRMCIWLGKLLSKSQCSFETVVWLNTKKKQTNACLKRPWQSSEWWNYKFFLTLSEQNYLYLDFFFQPQRGSESSLQMVFGPNAMNSAVPLTCSWTRTVSWGAVLVLNSQIKTRSLSLLRTFGRKNCECRAGRLDVWVWVSSHHYQNYTREAF